MIVFKRVLSFILTITLLTSCIPVVFGEVTAENPENTLDYEVLLSDSRVKKLIDFDFDDKSGYFENVTKSKERQAKIDSEHGTSYSFLQTGTNTAYKKTDEIISKGIVFINFDFLLKENVSLFYMRLLNDKWKANTAEDDPNMTETFAVKGNSVGFYANSSGWTVTESKKITPGEWLNVGMWLDLDLGKLYYVFDNEFVAETASNTNDLPDFGGILFTKQGDTGVCLDNIKVTAVNRTYFDTLCEKGVTIPEKLMDKVTIRADIGEIGNAVYAKNKDIPVKLSIYNKLSVTQNMIVKTKVKTRNGVDVTSRDFEVLAEPESTAVIEYKLPGMDRYGYNDLYLEIYSKEDNKLLATDSFEYALVNIPPEGLRNPKLGVIDHARPANARMGNPVINAQFASKAGFATTRSEHDWANYEKEKGVYQISDLYKELFAYKKTQNMGHLDILNYGNKLYGPDSPPSTPQSIEAYKNYAVSIVGDLIEMSEGREIEFELWNEYNNLGTWFNFDDQPASMYYELIKVTYPAVKEKYPDARMWGMSTIGVDNKWIEDVLKMGGGEYMDGISIHPYTFKLMPDLGDAIHKTLQLKEIIKKYGYDDETMPLRATEWGWPSCGINGYLNEAEQASAFIRMMVLNDHYDLFEQIDWYTINDGGDQPEQEQSFGLIRYMNGRIPYGVKPSYLAAANYNKLMTGAVYEKNVQIGEDVQSYKFKLRDGRDCVIAWVKDPNGAETVAVDLGAESAILMDEYGNEEVIYSNNGVFSVAYSQMPKYLIGNFTKLERAEKAFEFDVQTLNIPSGDKANVLVYQFSGNNVRLEVEGNSNVYAEHISGFDGNIAKITLKSKEKGNEKDLIKVKVYDGDKLMLIKEFPIKYISPVDVAVAVKPESYANPQYWQIEFNIENRYSAKGITGALEIIEPIELKECVENVKFEIKPKQSQKLKINVPDSILKTKVLDFKGDIVLETGERLPVEQYINLESCIYVETPPTIDGKMDKGEWKESASIDLSRGEYVYLAGNSYTGPTDLTGKLYTAWDKEYFYMAADIKDDVYAQDKMYGGVFWRSDGIQMAFAKYRGIASVSQFDFAKIDGDDRIVIERTPVASLMGELSKDKYVLKISNEGNSTIYEAKLPWSVIFPDGYTAAKNGELAITLLVNDNDGSVREGYLEFGSGMGSGAAMTSLYISFYMLGKSLIEDLK